MLHVMLLLRSMPLPSETCGHMRKKAVRFGNRLGDITSDIGRVSQGALLDAAMQLLSMCEVAVGDGSYGDS